MYDTIYLKSHIKEENYMNFLVIHMSDFHIKHAFNIENFIDSFVESIVHFKNEVDNEIIFVFTGDITDNSSKDCFDLFDKFIILLDSKLQLYKYHMNVFFVPGNHDIMLRYKELEQRYIDINRAFKYGDFDSFLDSEYQKMASFYNLAKKYNLFDNSATDKKIINISGKKIQINLLNTAFFSTLEHKDKEKHYIRPNEFSIFEDSKNDFEITIMHHSPEWFDENTRVHIDRLIADSDLYFFGHEHKQDFIEKNESKGILCNKIGVNENPSGCSFNICLLSINNGIERKYSLYPISYDSKVNKYVCEFDKCKTSLLPNKGKLVNSNYESFQKLPINDSFYNLNEIFTMPLLSFDNGDDPIRTIADFDKSIKSNKYIFIEGCPYSGKTTLLHYLFNYYCQNDKYVFFSYQEDFKYQYDKTIKHIISDNYKELSYNLFKQESLDKKILLIDDFDFSISKDFIDQLKKDFGYIVLVGNSLGLDKEITKTIKNSDFSFLRIERFSLQQKLTLIDNVKNSLNSNVSIDNINKCLNAIISKDNILDMTLPYYLSIVIEKIIKEKLYEERNTNNSFNLVFENNIQNKIAYAFSSDKVDIIHLALRKIAFRIFNKNVNECYIITHNDIEEVLNEINNDYKIKINSHDFCDKLIKQGLLRNEEIDTFRFAKNNIYSFFVAKYLDDLKTNDENIDEYIDKLSNNITFGNYSDILLFLAYFYKSDSFFKNIIDKINDIYANNEELSLDKHNSYVIQRKIKDNVDYQNKYEQRKSLINRIDKNERSEIKRREAITDEEIYSDNHMNDELEKDMKVIKLMEIVAKGVNSYNIQIKYDLRLSMFNSLMSFVYKIVYSIFDFSDKEYEDLYNTIVDEFLKNNPEAEKKKIEDEVTKQLYDIMTTFLLNISTSIIGIACSSQSLRVMNDIPDNDNNNNQIFNNVLIKTIFYERFGNEQYFYDYVMKTYPKIVDEGNRSLIKRVFAHFVTTTGMSSDKIDACCSKLKLKKKTILNLNNDMTKINQLTDRIKNKSNQ